MKFLILIFACMVLSGCVYLDMSMLDSAEPLQMGKPSAQAYLGQGIDIDTAVFIQGIDYDENYQPESTEHASGGGVQGYKGAIGLGGDFELGLKSWLGEGRGYKVNLKKRFYHQDSISVSISPAVYQLDKKGDEERYLYGWEIPLMVTYKPAKFLSGTLQVHYNVDNYTREYGDVNGFNYKSKGQYRLEHVGVIGGVKISASIISIYSELGVERIDAVNGPVTYVPVGAWGISIELF